MKIEKHRYPDGSIYVTIDFKIEDKSPVAIKQRINSYEDLWYIKCVKNALDDFGVEAYLEIPCMWEQQADRKFKVNESFGLKLVCDFINQMNFKKVLVHHPHSDVTAALLNNCFVISPFSFIHRVLSEMSEDVVVLSPDAGSFKWIFKELEKIDQNIDIECGSKTRNGSVLKNVINRQDFGGKDVLILDDICVYGGTFISIANIIKDRNVGDLYLATFHTTVQNPNKKLETLFKTVYTTNSKFDSYDLNNVKIITI